MEKTDMHLKYTFGPPGVKHHILKYVVIKPGKRGLYDYAAVVDKASKAERKSDKHITQMFL